MRRCLVLATLAFAGACWDGGPFAPRNDHHNPCHPGLWYDTLQPYPETCPVPNR